MHHIKRLDDKLKELILISIIYKTTMQLKKRLKKDLRTNLKKSYNKLKKRSNKIITNLPIKANKTTMIFNKMKMIFLEVNGELTTLIKVCL